VTSGIVTFRHAIVSVQFRRENQPDIPIECVIDTGFTDYLCVPKRFVDALGLQFEYNMRANLADNSNVLLPVYRATILWDGEERDIRVLATGERPLIGTALLDGYELVIQFTEGGLVTIDEL
jgi:clan AA aspartic protease